MKKLGRQFGLSRESGQKTKIWELSVYRKYLKSEDLVRPQ